MIYPYLEKLIREGSAQYRSMAIGGSGVGTIPVQQNEKIVITDFTWHPFSDVNPRQELLSFAPVILYEVSITSGTNPMFTAGTPVHSDVVGTAGQIEGIDDRVKVTSPGIVAALNIHVGDTINFNSIVPLVLVSGTVDSIVDANTFIVNCPPAPLSVVGFPSTCVEVENFSTSLTTGVFSLSFFLAIVIISGDWVSVNTISEDIPGDGVAHVLDVTAPALIVNTPLLDITSGASANIQQITWDGTAGFSPALLLLNDVVGAISDADALFNPDSGAFGIAEGDLFIISALAAIELAVRNCIHHLRFKSKGIEEIYNFRDNPTPIIPPILVAGEGVNFIPSVLQGFTFPDPIQVDTYITCLETVQIDIWKFSLGGNVFLQGTPNASANEPDVPNGYQGAVANPPVLDITTAQGAHIRPLGMRENTVVLARKKDQFVDDIGDLTELAIPSTNQSFPLVNIGYVLIDNSQK